MTPPPPPQAAPASGGWVIGGRYRVLDRIGAGGMAEVFQARDEVLDRLVAVKVFRAEHVAADAANGAERQQLEVAALARLNHPNLIALYDGSLDAAPHAYIVMELIEGPSLAARIAEGPLPEASVREIGIQLADGLAYVHAQGMVHRDVKPENILLGIDRSDDDHTVRARLSDFGIVRLLGSERLTNANFTLGTASYLAPEQARGSAVEPPADIYALGLVLLEALTGRRMFDGPPLEAALARLSQRPVVPAELPAPWPGLLHAMTEFDPALRPSASEVARALRNEGSRALPLVPVAVPVAAGFADAPTGMVPVPPPGPVPYDAAAATASPAAAPRRRRRLSPMAITAVLSLLVILTTLGIFLFTGNDSKSPASPPTTGGSPAARTSAAHRTDKSASSGVTTTRRTHSSSPATTRSSSSSSAPKTSSSAPPTRSSAPSTSSAPPKPVTSAPTTSRPAPRSSPVTTPTQHTSPPTSTAPTTQTSASNASTSTAAPPA